MITLPLIFLAIWLCVTNIIPLWVCIVCCAFWGIHFAGSTALIVWSVRLANKNKKIEK
jgi:hypothetical protein